MKKNYIKPEIEIVELTFEGVMATGSEVQKVEETVGGSEMLSQKERSGSLWSDVSFD